MIAEETLLSQQLNGAILVRLTESYVRAGDVTPELAPVEPAEDSWTTMEVDDGQREQEESEDQPEELRRVLEAETFSNKPVFVKTKGTGAQHRRQTNKELAKQEQYGPRIYSDFFHMCEKGVSTPMLALPQRWSRKA